MSDALFAVQLAVANILAANSEVQSQLGTPPRLFDHVQPDAVFPYVVFGPAHIVPHDTKTETGFEQIIVLNIWSRYRGGKETRAIFQALYDALHRATLAVAGQILPVLRISQRGFRSRCQRPHLSRRRPFCHSDPERLNDPQALFHRPIINSNNPRRADGNGGSAKRFAQITGQFLRPFRSALCTKNHDQS